MVKDLSTLKVVFLYYGGKITTKTETDGIGRPNKGELFCSVQFLRLQKIR